MADQSDPYTASRQPTAISSRIDASHCAGAQLKHDKPHAASRSLQQPSLRTIVFSFVAFWCITGSWAHGWTILLYPLSWMLIAACFLWYHNRVRPDQISEPTHQVMGPKRPGQHAPFGSDEDAHHMVK